LRAIAAIITMTMPNTMNGATQLSVDDEIVEGVAVASLLETGDTGLVELEVEPEFAFLNVLQSPD